LGVGVALVALAGLFVLGDDLRRLFGASADALAGAEAPDRFAKLVAPKKNLSEFGEQEPEGMAEPPPPAPMPPGAPKPEPPKAAHRPVKRCPPGYVASEARCVPAVAVASKPAPQSGGSKKDWSDGILRSMEDVGAVAPPPPKPPPPPAPPPPDAPPPPSGPQPYDKHTVYDFGDDTIDGDLVKPDGEHLEARRRVRPQRVERYPTLEAPDEVAPAKEFAVLVSLTEDLMTPEVEVKQGETTEEGKLAMALPAGRKEWTIDVVLSAPGFTVVGGENTGKLVLPEAGDSTPAKFRLAAKAIRKAREERKLFATLWHEGAYLAKLLRPIAVVQAGAEVRAPVAAAVREAGLEAAVREAAPQDTPAEPGELDFGTAEETPLPRRRRPAPLSVEVKPPDLTIFVRHNVDAGNPGAAELTVVSTHLSPPIRSYPFRAAAGLREFLLAQYGKFAAAVPRGVEAVSDAPELPLKERTVPLVRGFGRQLWDQFAPAPFKDAFWRLEARLGAKFHTIQIVTDDPLLPWELMRPSTGERELDLLGIEFLVARWHVSDAGGQLERPPQASALQGLVAIAPRYTGAAALPSQEAELDALSAVEGFRREEGKLAAMKRLFESLPGGIVHFAGHGVVRAEGGVPEYAIRLEDTELSLLQWRGMASRARGAHPLFFFNACEVGQAGRVAGFVDGWAPAVLDLGASGYIGGLWPLGDRGAADFALAFYRTLSAGLHDEGAAAVADLLRRARKRFYDTGDPTHLAYVYYGDPNFRFVR
jgi:hypothetical protein